MESNKAYFDKLFEQQWRALGFYYDFDDRIQVNQWRFFGSLKGLKNFAKLLKEYAENPRHEAISEHDQYEPYLYLKVMTWDKPVITDNYIGGSVKDLKFLSQLIVFI